MHRDYDSTARHYEAISMIDFILEDHSVRETSKEFRVSTDTVRRRIVMIHDSAVIDRNIPLLKKAIHVLKLLKMG